MQREFLFTYDAVLMNASEQWSMLLRVIHSERMCRQWVDRFCCARLVAVSEDRAACEIKVLQKAKCDLGVVEDMAELRERARGTQRSDGRRFLTAGGENKVVWIK